MKVVEALVFLFKGMLFLDGHLTHGALGSEIEKRGNAGTCG